MCGYILTGCENVPVNFYSKTYYYYYTTVRNGSEVRLPSESFTDYKLQYVRIIPSITYTYIRAHALSGVVGRVVQNSSLLILR